MKARNFVLLKLVFCADQEVEERIKISFINSGKEELTMQELEPIAKVIIPLNHCFCFVPFAAYVDVVEMWKMQRSQ